ncbi:putative gag-pol poly protein [Stemphylium lycopersici]|uniref:RNA-directed DNA polymerase n=1 Tax=Stemphylium lycopersici TaxID=183478 RepID=A0A364MRP1_STELY|nr:putative gag-pol poly protein [Stemphylium lycopersici]RAR00731.1 gag-pol poly protein [Stemphylium lycopersici]
MATPSNVVMSMARPRHTTLVFTGKDVTEFLEDFNRQADNGSVPNTMRVSILPDYLSDNDRSISRILKRLPGYHDKDWVRLQESMKEQWQDEDTAIMMSKRSYLQAYIHSCLRDWPGLAEYYTYFSSAADACVSNQQVPEGEVGIMFFKGLPRSDKEAVMYYMPNAPNGDDWATYEKDKIYSFLKAHHKKMHSLDEMHRQERGDVDAEMRRIMLSNRKATFTPESVKEAVAEIKKTAATPSTPSDVDIEVEDLIQSLGDMKLELATIDMLMAHPETSRLLKKPSNYAYFIAKATTASFPQERNDGSFITPAPRNTAPGRGTASYGGREYRNTCNMCNDSGHQVRNCELYNHLRKMGWISFDWDPDAKRGTYYFGPPQERLGEIPGAPPPNFILQWLKAKIREFYNVTDDVLDQPASSVVPEKFPGGDSRPAARYPKPRGLTAAANVATSSDRYDSNSDVLVQFRQFQDQVFSPISLSGQDRLDEVDAENIILGGGEQALLSLSESSAAMQPKTKQGAGSQNMDNVRTGDVRKRGRPAKSMKDRDVDRIIRESASSAGDAQGIDQPPIDASYESQDTWGDQGPFSIVKPPHSVTISDNMSADPKQLQQGRKKKAVKFLDSIPDEELRDMLRGNPSRIATALLNQEVRSITVADLIGQSDVRKHLRNLLEEDVEVADGGGGVNALTVGGATESGCSGYHPDSVLPPDWPALASPTYRTPPTTGDSLNEASDDSSAHCNATSSYGFSAQTRHRATGKSDTWIEEFDSLPAKAVRNALKRDGRVYVQSDLPECWVMVHGNSMKCLIDTGAQMNILRLSAARAMKIPYEIMHHRLGDPPQGVTSANGTHDPFVGTAFNVPIRIGSVTTPTTFRIVANASAWSDPTAGLGDYHMLYTRDDVQEWMQRMNTAFSAAHGGLEDTDSPPELDQFSIMCELNRQQMRRNQLLYTLQHGNSYTMYKSVDKKVRPVDIPRREMPMEFGREDWKQRAIERQQLRLSVRSHDPGPYDNWFERRYAAFPRGARLTTERVSKLHTGDQLTPQERAMNPWHLVPKKDGDVRWISNAQRLNSVTLRDANLPPTADEFSERFAGCKIISLMDLFSGYDQITLHPDSRDMTAFQTPIGLIRSCTMVMGATNSVAAFQRVMTKILKDHWPETMPFVDDITSGGPKTDYQGEESIPGVRRYVLEHIQQLDRVLADIERAGGTVNGKKCYFLMERLEVVGYEVSPDGRHPNQRKVEKILNWPPCKNQKEVRSFIGICVYYRIWVLHFAIVAKPLFRLLRDSDEFAWLKEQDEAMYTLKQAIVTAPALVNLDYSDTDTYKIYLMTDASQEGAGACIEQLKEDGKRHPVRFESTLWSAREQTWHSTKLECKAVLWALKKFRTYLYGVHFTIETDAATLIAQLNRSSTDNPGSVMNRWISTIMLWDFEIKHIPGKKNVVADALSRYPKPEGSEPPEETEDDLEEFIDHMIGNVNAPALPVSHARLLRQEFSEASEQYAQFLVNLKSPKGMQSRELRAWKKRALNFFVRDGILFKKTSRNIAIRRVVDDKDLQTAAVWNVHQQIGHRGVNAVYSILSQRYWWNGMYEHVRKRLATCPDCQLRSSKRMVDMLTNTYSFAIWETVAIDVVYMPQCFGKKYLVIARDYLSGWPEARALSNNKSKTIAEFIYEDIICRWSTSRKLMVDGGPDFAKVRVQASGHNPQAMGKIEGSHKPIVNALAKLPGPWVKNLPAVLLADRISIQEQTGYSPYQLVTGQNPVLPIDLALPTWQTLPFREVKDRAQLLAIRAMQLDLRDQFKKEAIARTNRMRAAKKEYWDDTREIRREEIARGDLVLLWNSVREIDMSRDRKLDTRWLGPYRVHEARPDRGTYRLEDLDGTVFPHTTPGRRLKLFRQRVIEDIVQEDRGNMKLWDPSYWQNVSSTLEVPVVADSADKPPQPHETSPPVHSRQQQDARTVPRVVITKRLTDEERRAYTQDWGNSDTDSTNSSSSE